MNCPYRIMFCLALFFAEASYAQLAVTVSPAKIVGQKAVVPLALKNNLAEKVESVRAVAFLIDEQGKMVGQSIKWVIGGTKDRPALEPKQSTTFNFVITSSHPFTSTNLTAKVLVNRVILGGVANSLTLIRTSKYPIPRPRHRRAGRQHHRAVVAAKLLHLRVEFGIIPVGPRHRGTRARSSPGSITVRRTHSRAGALKSLTATRAEGRAGLSIITPGHHTETVAGGNGCESGGVCLCQFKQREAGEQGEVRDDGQFHGARGGTVEAGGRGRWITDHGQLTAGFGQFDHRRLRDAGQFESATAPRAGGGVELVAERRPFRDQRQFVHGDEARAGRAVKFLAGDVEQLGEVDLGGCSPSR